ncbi:hypothetical protein IWGMT90018_48370 [Mycobacterium kiyosense]|nr:hypothetical protein IWGMT90018_48370 [Mycobacterium kiyosense]
MPPVPINPALPPLPPEASQHAAGGAVASATVTEQDAARAPGRVRQRAGGSVTDQRPPEQRIGGRIDDRIDRLAERAANPRLSGRVNRLVDERLKCAGRKFVQSLQRRGGDAAAEQRGLELLQDGRLGAAVRRCCSAQIAHELLVIGGRLSRRGLVLAGVRAEQGRDGDRHFVGGRGGHLGGRQERGQVAGADCRADLGRIRGRGFDPIQCCDDK